jgi:glycerol-3-phosphate acyltransferase PlsY
MPEIINSFQSLGLTALLAYLLGSIPFGIVIAKLMGLGDLRKIGSGNIGATNVLRTGSKTAAFLTLVLDAGKGGVAVLIARAMLGEDAAQLAGLAAFLGHLFPVWLKFRGGKGVATFFGVLLALSWPLCLAACATWLTTALILRISSLAGLMSAGLTPVWMVLLGYTQGLTLGVVLTVLIYVRHLENIKRIKSGTEPKIGGKGRKS